MNGPWQNWVPGVLSKNQMKVLCDEGFVVKVEQPDKAIGPSSIDLHLSDDAYETTGGSIKPFGDQYRYQIEKQGLIKSFDFIDGGYQLKRGRTYLICIRERFEKVAQLAAANIFGVSTPKSSVGRMDVLVRLVVDFMDAYDGFVPDRLGKSSGEMFLEVTPISFDVRARPGDSLCQLRFVYGRPEHCELRGPEIALTTLGVRKEDGSLSADLEPSVVGRSKATKASAFRAREDAQQTEPFDLWKKAEDQRPDPKKFWSPEISDPATKRLTIAKGSFYILRSKERIRVPSGVAVYCRAVDETIGEMRIHYAGFVHPGFGANRRDGIPGTPLIFEVRGHDLDVSLKDGETMARLQFYRMSEDLDPEVSNYNEQSLTLSGFFGDRP